MIYFLKAHDPHNPSMLRDDNHNDKHKYKYMKMVNMDMVDMDMDQLTDPSRTFGLVKKHITILYFKEIINYHYCYLI